MKHSIILSIIDLEMEMGQIQPCTGEYGASPAHRSIQVYSATVMTIEAIV